jgi:uncharacterized protein YndB with AHSA1/START domain
MSNVGSLKVSTPSDREVALTRVFNAPRHLVYAAWTKPELLKRWLAPNAWSLAVCEIDLRVGGAYRYVWISEEKEMGMGGVYREIVPNERLVATEVFDESWYPGEGLVTTVFVEEGGRTTMTSTILYESKAARDAVVNSPMDEGASACYDRLAELLAEDAVVSA